MIREVRIKNYKSVQKLKLDLGQLTVLIGENGSGKSNILEAIALGSAAANNKLDNEFLSSRGIRVTEPQFMRSAFDKENIDKEISIYFKGEDNLFLDCILQNDNKPYSKWIIIAPHNIFNEEIDEINKIVKNILQFEKELGSVDISALI
jgi:AAA15 family ATPase/GTPase